MARHPDVPDELKRGPFTLVEAHRAGLTWKQLQGVSWRRVEGGMYVWAGLPDGPLLALAAIRRRLPDGAVFSGRTAAWLHGLDTAPCDPVEVTIPPAVGVARRAGVVVRRAELPAIDVVERRALPTTSAFRMVVDLASRPPLTEAVVLADMALHKRLVRVADLRAYVAAHQGAWGVARLRRVVDLAEPLAESPMETRLRLLLVLAGLPRPQAQARLHDERGRFLARADLYYPTARLAIEYDGATHRDSLAQDDRRQNALVGAGYRLLRFTAADLQRGPAEVVARVRSALAPARSTALNPPGPGSPR